MAVTKTYLKKTHQEVIVKIAGTSGTQTISLADDLFPATGQVIDGATQTVNITAVSWTGETASVATVTRNSVRVFTLPGGASIGQIEFNGQSMAAENTENTSDVVVAISGGQAEVWLKLHKISGYKTTIEPEQFGPYDNPLLAGE